jgi:hypothetical protein
MSRPGGKSQSKKRPAAQASVTVGVDQALGPDEVAILTVDLTGAKPHVFARMPITAVRRYLDRLRAPQEDPRDSLEAWQRTMADVCGGCGLRKLDAAGTCGACGKQKARRT